MINKIKQILLFFLSFITTNISAQEILTDLKYNPALKNINQSSKFYKKQASGDTISLPFFDDFSKPGIYPDTAYWLDKDAYINTDYPLDPISIGVATLDGIDSNGNPYDSTFTDKHGIADSLTSRPINLELPGDTTIYLSFFYQAEGNGNAPNSEDSLILEFLQKDTSWVSIWSIEGSSIDSFRLVMINISDTNYLHKGFQFRFRNYATLSGNWDHWHIDYVKLDRLRSIGDTIMDDVAFVVRGESLLKSYKAMPWTHFIADSLNQMKDTLSMIIRNNSDAVKNLSFRYEINDDVGITLHNYSGGSINSDPYFLSGYHNYQPHTRPPLDFIFPYQSGDSALFEVKHIINTTPDDNRNNDTLVHFQEFYNYYAYDDGTAEKGYGLNSQGGKIAYQFNLTKEDTLRGVSMFFTQLSEDMSNKTFKLVVWSSLWPENIIYQQTSLNPSYENAINKFHFYRIDDTVLVVSGTIYVGWIQTSDDILNLGFDVNTNSQEKMFYNVSGTFLNSVYEGSWMIRPVFGDSVPVNTGVGDYLKDRFHFLIHPNPANDRIFIRCANLKEKEFEKVQINIFDTFGRVVFSQNQYSNNIDISQISQGFYILRIYNSATQQSFTQKIIINR